MFWLLLIFAAILLLNTNWSVVQGNLARLYLLVGGAASRTGSLVGSRLGSILLGAVLALVLMNGVKWLPSLPSLDWRSWVPSVGPVVPGGARQIYIVHETGTQTPAHQKLFTELRSAPELSAHKLLIIDADQPAPSLAPFITTAKKHTLPSVVVTTEAGVVLADGPVTDKASVIARVK